MIYSVGHSTLSKEEFARLFSDIEQPIVVDVRSHPTSRWPQFQKRELETWLPGFGIGYEWWPGLGGWRKKHAKWASDFAEVDVDLSFYLGSAFPKQRIAKKRKEKTGWYIYGLWDYQWYQVLGEFLQAADELIERGKTENLAIMCCELLPWKCHRSMVADYLAYRGVECVHLQPKFKPHSEMLGNRLERYHPEVRESWDLWISGPRYD